MNFHGGDIYSLQNRVLDFSSNINPLGVPESFRQSLMERMDDFIRYPDLKYRALRGALAEYLEFNEPELIIPGNGAVELIFKTIASLGVRRMITLSPTFSEYAHAGEQRGVEVIDLPGYGPDFDSLHTDELLERLEPKTLVVICNPNNPTGTFVPRDQMCRLAEKLLNSDCFLLIDEAFIEFTDEYPANSMVGELNRFPNLLIVRAATKFFGMPGIRLGFAVSRNRELVQEIENRLEPWNVNAAAVIAGCTVYRDREYIERSREWVRTERTFLFEKLRAIPELTVYPSKTNYHLVRIKSPDLDAWQFKGKMITKGILVRTPDGFHHLSPYHLRLAVKDRASNEKMVQAIGEVLSENGC